MTTLANCRNSPYSAYLDDTSLPHPNRTHSQNSQSPDPFFTIPTIPCNCLKHCPLTCSSSGRRNKSPDHTTGQTAHMHGSNSQGIIDMKQSLKIAVAGVGVGMVSLAGAGLASAHSPGDSEARDEITNRVAEILGVDAANLGDAMEQAREEHRSEEMDVRLDQAVTDSTITQEEADEIRTWLDSRPAVLEELKGEIGQHGPRQNGDNGGGLEVHITALVEDGTITQAEADEALAWSEARPEAMDDLRPDKGEGEGRRGRGQHQGQGRGFEQRINPGEDGEIGRFGGFRFQLPPGFDGGFEAPPADPA